MMPTAAHKIEIVSRVALEGRLPHEAQIRFDAPENPLGIDFIVRKYENTRSCDRIRNIYKRIPVVVGAADTAEGRGAFALEIVASTDMEGDRFGSFDLRAPLRPSIFIGPSESQIDPAFERFSEARFLEESDLPGTEDKARPNLSTCFRESALGSEDVLIAKLENISDRTRSRFKEKSNPFAPFPERKTIGVLEKLIPDTSE
jgi:hypothetical protein